MEKLKYDKYYDEWFEKAESHYQLNSKTIMTDVTVKRPKIGEPARCWKILEKFLSVHTNSSLDEPETPSPEHSESEARAARLQLGKAIRRKRKISYAYDESTKMDAGDFTNPILKQQVAKLAAKYR